MDCGNKFREAKELMEEKSKHSIIEFIAGPVIALGGLIIFVAFGDKKDSEEIRTKQYEAECYKNEEKK